MLELALREALQLGHNYIGTEHILLGLIREGEGAGAQVLIKLGCDLNRVRQQVIQILSGYTHKGGEAVEIEAITGQPEIDAPELAGVVDPSVDRDSFAFEAVRIRVEEVLDPDEPVTVSIQRQTDGRKAIIKLVPLNSSKPLEILEVSVKFRDYTGTVRTNSLEWPKAKKPKKKKAKKQKPDLAPEEPTATAAAPMPAGDLAGGPPTARPTEPLGTEKHSAEPSILMASEDPDIEVATGDEKQGAPFPPLPKSPTARRPRVRTTGGKPPAADKKD